MGGALRLDRSHQRLLRAIGATRQQSSRGMLAEQVWDGDPFRARRQSPGRPSGSAMPLVWAHAEFIKLMVSRHVGHPVDRPRAVWRRYQGHRSAARYEFWWPHAPIREFPAGSWLAVALRSPPKFTGVMAAGARQWTRQPTTEVSAFMLLHSMSAAFLLGSTSNSLGNGKRAAPGTAATIKWRQYRPMMT